MSSQSDSLGNSLLASAIFLTDYRFLWLSSAIRNIPLPPVKAVTKFIQAYVWPSTLTSDKHLPVFGIGQKDLLLAWRPL